MTKTTDYIGNMIYQDGQLQRILIPGGYIENNTYYFFLTDHLGNNRVVADQNGTVIQTNHYYPFGTPFAETSYAEQGKQPYKYNDKELDQMHQLNLYDYHARQLEAPLGRFTTMDPLAEKYPHISPYVYVENNPLIYIDPTGKEKLNGFHISTPEHEYMERRRMVDNYMIHIYAHGSPYGFTFIDNQTNEHIEIRTSSDLINFLDQYSNIWKNRKEDELIFIALHSCNTGKGWATVSDSELGYSFAERMSAEIENTIFIAPSIDLFLDIDGTETVKDKNTSAIGNWSYFHNERNIIIQSDNINPDEVFKNVDPWKVINDFFHRARMAGIPIYIY